MPRALNESQSLRKLFAIVTAPNESLHRTALADCARRRRVSDDVRVSALTEKIRALVAGLR